MSVHLGTGQAGRGRQENVLNVTVDQSDVGCKKFHIINNPDVYKCVVREQINKWTETLQIKKRTVASQSIVMYRPHLDPDSNCKRKSGQSFRFEPWLDIDYYY